MSRFNTRRYSEVMGTLYNQLYNNNLFNSMVEGSQKPNNPTSIDIKTASVTDLMYALSEHIGNLSSLQFADAKRVEAIGAQNEEKITAIGEEIEKRFVEYKKTHKDYEGPDYRRFEFMTNMINSYKSQQQELAKFNEDKLRQNLNGINESIEEYKNAQNELNDAIREFDDFTNDPNYDASFISANELYKFKGKEVTGETILEVGTGFILQDADVKLDELDKELAETNKTYDHWSLQNREERIKELNEESKVHDKNLADLLNKYTEERRELTDKLEEIQNAIEENKSKEINNAYYDAVDEISRIDMGNVSKTIAAGGLEYNEGDSTLQWAEDLKSYSPEEIENRSKEVERIANSMTLELADDKEKLEITVTNIDSINKQIEQIDKDIKDIKKSQEYKKVQEEYEAAKKEVKAIGEVIDSIYEKGLESVSQETLSKYGIKYNGLDAQRQANEAKVEIDNFNKEFNSWRPFKTATAKVLSEGIKGLNEAFNSRRVITKTDTFEETASLIEDQLEDYLSKHNGEPPFDGDISKFGDLVSDALEPLMQLEGFNGKLTSKEQAHALNRFFKNEAYLEQIAKSIKKDAPPLFQKMKTSAEASLKAFHDIQANRSGYMSMITLAGMAELNNTVADIEGGVLGKLRSLEMETKHKVSELEDKVMDEFEREKTKELRQTKEALKVGLEKAKDKVLELDEKITRDTEGIKYLKSAKKLIDARGKLNVADKQVVDKQKEKSETQQKIKNLDKAYTKGVQTIEDVYKGNVEKIHQKYDAIEKKDLQNHEASVREIKEKAESVKLFKNKVAKLESKKENLQQGARNFLGKAEQYKSSIKEISEGLGQAKDVAIASVDEQLIRVCDRLANSPKSIGWNSGYFNDVVDAANDYIRKVTETDNATLTEEKHKELSKNLREKIGVYLKERDDGKPKKTAGGQMRLDTMKDILAKLDQKEALANRFDKEKIDLARKANDIPQPQVKSVVEKNIIAKTDLGKVVNPNEKLKEISAKNRVTEEQIKEFFDPLTKDVSSKSDYLGKIATSCVTDLAHRNNKGFTKAVAAVFVANKLDVNNNPKYNTPQVMDKLLNLYAKSPKVMEFATKLVSGQMKPGDFVVDAAKPENMTIVHNQASKIKEAQEPQKKGPENVGKSMH